MQRDIYVYIGIDQLFKLTFPKVNQYIGGKWVIHGTKHHKGY